MLPQFGFSEFLLIAIVALVVVGPQELPLMMRKFGQWVGRMRAAARDVQAAFDDLGRQAELKALREEIETLKRQNTLTDATQAISDTDADLRRSTQDPPR
jgi:sec-independent protein translocase protein TatB